jgi:hypothetical protein
VARDPEVLDQHPGVDLRTETGTDRANARPATRVDHCMFPAENLRDWRGKKVIDPESDKIGELEAVYVDTATDEPSFITVKVGFIGRHRLVFVPLAGATVTPDAVRVRHEKKLVQDAPSIDTDGELAAADEPASSPTTPSRTCSDRREDAGWHGADVCRFNRSWPRAAGHGHCDVTVVDEASQAIRPSNSYLGRAASYRSHHGTAAGRTMRQPCSPVPRDMR